MQIGIGVWLYTTALGLNFRYAVTGGGTDSAVTRVLTEAGSRGAFLGYDPRVIAG